MNLTLDVPEELLEEIDEYRWVVRAKSRRACILLLVRQALEAMKPKPAEVS